MLVCWLALIAAGLSAPALRAADLNDREFAALLADFQAAVDAERERYRIPGMTAAFVLPDGRMGKVASGSADHERQLAMTPDSRMLSGSIGKTMTSAVAVRLAEQGVWLLDDKLSKYLGHNAWFAKLPNAEHLTVKLLLQHRGGLENYYDNPRFLEDLKQKSTEDPSYAPSFETLIQFRLRSASACFRRDKASNTRTSAICSSAWQSSRSPGGPTTRRSRTCFSIHSDWC